MKVASQGREKLTVFLTSEIWRRHASALPPFQALPLRMTRVLVLAGSRFYRDACALRASALTFYAMLAMVPVAALALGIAKGFGLQKVLERELAQQLSGQQEVMAWILAAAEALLENTSGSLIAGLGVAVLLWSVLKVLHHIEASFNIIWEVEEARTLARRLGDYLALILAGTLFLVISGSATLYLAALAEESGVPDTLLGVVKLAPFPLSWVLFTMIYRVMPNTVVPFSSACLAGILAGSAYQALQRLYFHFQVGAAQYNAVYGSLAALPLFMIWLELSWSIVLFGAEVAFAHQRADEYELEPDPDRLNAATCKAVALEICHRVLHGFSRSEPPLTPSEVAAVLKFPVRLVRRVSDQLIASGLLRASCPDRAEPSLLVARPPEQYTIAAIFSALERLGRPADPGWSGDPILAQAVTHWESVVASLPANRRLLDLR
jgi:membrane protein